MEPFDLSQPAISKHIKVLEAAGLISAVASLRSGRSPRGKALKDVAEWIDHYRHFWAGSLIARDYFKKCKLTQRKEDEMNASIRRPSRTGKSPLSAFSTPPRYRLGRMERSTTPKALVGAERITNTFHEFDFGQVGRSWRFVMRSPNGIGF